MVHSIFGASGALPRPAERMGEFQPAGETNATSPASAANHSGGCGPTNLSTVSADLLNFCKTTGRLRAAQGNTATRQPTLIRPSTNIRIAIMIAPATIKATTGLPNCLPLLLMAPPPIVANYLPARDISASTPANTERSPSHRSARTTL
jgi:hypothetical protein